MTVEWSLPEIVETIDAVDERLWIPAAMPGVYMRPLLFDVSHGAWTNLVRLRSEGIISRHRHPGPVHGFVIKGEWRYAGKDWIASPNTFIYEPAGDTHTLIALPGESQTLFNIQGALIEIDDNDDVIGFADVFTRIEQAASHFKAVGLGRDYVTRFIR